MYLSDLTSDLSVVSNVIIHFDFFDSFHRMFTTFLDLLVLIKMNDNCCENYVICDQVSRHFGVFKLLQVNDERWAVTCVNWGELKEKNYSFIRNPKLTFNINFLHYLRDLLHASALHSFSFWNEYQRTTKTIIRKMKANLFQFTWEIWFHL